MKLSKGFGMTWTCGYKQHTLNEPDRDTLHMVYYVHHHKVIETFKL